MTKIACSTGQTLFVKEKVIDENGNCIKCGAETYCKHEEISTGSGYLEVFELFCPECKKINEWRHLNGSGDDTETCPWCGKKAL